MTPILSTRSLSTGQRAKLRKAGLLVEEYDAIGIKFLDYILPEGYNHYIFTSKNGVKGFLRSGGRNFDKNSSPISYCVGEKTSSYLKENALKVIKMAENASELGHFISNMHKNERFLIFTGNRNRPELKEILNKKKILFKEVKVYETSLVPRKFSQEFGCILFYSPSGVESFRIENKTDSPLAICIGETTAREARKYFEKVLVSDKPTVESVIDRMISTYPTI
jgi:uroporphyrinogen-III synthase